MVIYKIHCLINDKLYIGWCANFHIRKRTHLQHLTRNNHHSIKLQRAWNKYGAENFNFEIIENNISHDDILNTEVEYIKRFNSYKGGYNCTPGGEGVVGRFGRHHHNSKYYYLYTLNGDYVTKKLTIKGVTKFTKKELRFDKRGFGICGDYVVSKEYTGKRFTKHHKIFKYDENYKLVSSYISTSHIDDTSKDEIYESVRQNKVINGFIWKIDVSNEQKKQFESLKIKIDMFDKNKTYIRSFDSVSEAYEYLKIPVNGNISKCLKNKQKSAYGFIWKIKE
jgi:group I intron endonuclease